MVISNSDLRRVLREAAGDPAGESASKCDLIRFDEVCDLFVDAWQDGRSPRIEDFLKPYPELERPGLLRELLILELELRRREGEQPAPEEYSRRFPEYESVVASIVHHGNLGHPPSVGPSEPIFSSLDDHLVAIGSGDAVSRLADPVPSQLGPYSCSSRSARGAWASSTWPSRTQPDPPQGRPEDHQAGHGLAPGHRPVRGRAPGAGPDGPPQHRQGPRRRHHRRPAGPTSSWSWSRASRSPSTATRPS